MVIIKNNTLVLFNLPTFGDNSSIIHREPKKIIADFSSRILMMEMVRNQISPEGWGGVGVRGQKPLRGFYLMSQSDI